MRNLNKFIGSFYLSLMIFACLLYSTWYWWHSGNTYLNGNNGDHYYYVAQARMLGGMTYRDALEITALQFNYARPSVDLDYEWLDPSIGPLVYPRMALPVIMAPFVNFLTVWPNLSVFLPGFLMGLTGLLAIFVFAKERLGIWWASLITAVSALSPLLTEYRFGIYTEAPLILGLTLWLVISHASYDTSAQIKLGKFAVAAIPLICLSRQAVLLLIAYSIGYLFWELCFRSSSFASSMRRFGPTVAASVFAYLLIQKWAPYNPVPYAKYNSDGQELSSVETIMALLRNLYDISAADVKRLLPGGESPDVIYLFLLLVTAILAMRFIKRPEIGGILFVFAFLLLTTMLNGRPTSMRYLSTSFPFIVIIFVYLFGEIKRNKNCNLYSFPRAWIGIAGVMSFIVVATTVIYCRPAPITNWVKIDSSQFSPWNLSVERGWLACSGNDFQVWFKDESGQIYAASGPAMQRTFFTKRISELYVSQPEILSSPAIEITKRGMELCGGSFMKR